MLKDHFVCLVYIVDVYMYIAYACMYVYALDTVVLIFWHCLCANVYTIFLAHLCVGERCVFFVSIHSFLTAVECENKVLYIIYSPRSN